MRIDLSRLYLLLLCTVGVFSALDGKAYYNVDENQETHYMHRKGGCQKPKQGPPGPQLLNYISAYYMGAPQLVSGAGVYTTIRYTNVDISNGWVLSGQTDFTNNQSGIYLVSFGAGIYSGGAAGGDSQIRCLKNGVEVDAGHLYQSFSIDCVANMTSSFLVSYNAGDVLTFQFRGSTATMSMFGNSFVTITRIQ